MCDKEFQVVIKGFSSKQEALEFCNWYSGQGEQDASIWFEYRKEEGLIEHSGMYCEKIEEDGNTVNMELKMYE